MSDDKDKKIEELKIEFLQIRDIDRGGFTQSLPEELSRRFDILVSMDEHVVVDKGVSIATYALCGCIAGYIDNEDESIFFHYSPLRARTIDFLMNQYCNDKTRKVHFFVPGEYGENYELQPKKNYSDNLLGLARQKAEGLNVPALFHCYSEHQMLGKRYQGTAMVDKNNTVYRDYIIVDKNDKIGASLSLSDT